MTTTTRETTTTENNIILNPELLDGKIVEVIGFSMLEKMGSGKFRLSYKEQRYGGAIFEIFRPKGKRLIVCHRASSIASSIEAVNRGRCLNGLSLTHPVNSPS